MRSNKNLREVVSNSRASERNKSQNNLNNAATSGKITTMRIAPNASVGTYHTSAENGIKATQNFPQARGAAAASASTP